MRNTEPMLRYNYFESVDSLKQLQALADRMDTSVSDLIRQAVKRILADNALIAKDLTDATAEDPDPAAS